MNAGKQAVWLFTALIGLSFLSWYFASSDIIFKLDQDTLSTTVDTTINHLSVRQYDLEGKLTNSLVTPRLEHIPKDDQYWLQKPFVQIAQKGQTPWEIRAEEAISLYGGKEITFSHQVIMHQDKSLHTAESTLLTEEITYFPDDKIARTEKEVTFKQPGNVVQSQGIMAYLAKKRVKLLGKARGSYDPKHG